MRLQVILLQRVVPSYRKFLFRDLSLNPLIDLKIIVGSDFPLPSKVRSDHDLSGIPVHRLATLFLGFDQYRIPYPIGMLRALVAFEPNVLICEGLSHPFAVLKVIIYKVLFPNVKTILWTLGGLPQAKVPRPLVKLLYRLLDKFVDHYLVYSSYGKSFLTQQYLVDSSKISVAHNISDTTFYLPFFRPKAPSEFQGDLTVAYVGSLVAEKNIEACLETMMLLKGNSISLYIVGSGPHYPFLKDICVEHGLDSVYFMGSMNKSELAKFLGSIHLLFLPGRGGMVLSEAMALGVPPILFAADGIEYDLIVDQQTGFLADSYSAHSFASLLRDLDDRREKIINASSRCHQLIDERFRSSTYAQSFLRPVLNLFLR